ncbi:hypothetical protein ACFVZH_39360 [Streptomyces sp. NPDC059534]|uniref:hypothetical protein n=1 Tax=Streptomyces sp. NPDC059534 TaxID=3346859 RepID=UPI003689FB8F
MATSDKSNSRSRGEGRRPNRRSNSTAAQSDVLRASMQDAIRGSHINAGQDSTAALLQQLAQTQPLDPVQDGTATGTANIPLARPEPVVQAEPTVVQPEPAVQAEPQEEGPAQAQRSLQASFVDNRLNSNTWQSWGFRLVPDVKERLAKRLEADKRSSGNRRLAQGHYVNAAMLTVCPKSVKGQLALIRGWLTERDAYTEQGRPSNYLVSKPVWDTSSTLDMELTAASKRGQVVYLFSAVLERFLDMLDEGGTLPPPGRRNS